MNPIKKVAQAVRVQSVGKITKCRNSGAHIVFIKAVSHATERKSKK